MGSYLVIGSGISGATAARSLADLGHRVLIVERAALAGGSVLDYYCKAARTCTRCGVCVALAELERCVHHPNVTTWLDSEVTRASIGTTGVCATVRRSSPSIALSACVACDRCLGACPAGCITRVARGELVQYHIDRERCVLQAGGQCTACADACPAGAVEAASTPHAETEVVADAVLVAGGHEPYPARQRPRLGYGRLPNVLSGVDIERLLQERTALDPEIRSVGFIQCVGSRDPSIGRPYCSAVCCAYALRTAAALLHRSPDLAITIYVIDVQNFDKTFSVFRKDLAAANVRFVRGVPSEVERSAGGRLRVVVPDGKAGGGEPPPYAAEHDMVVLSVGMGPSAGAHRAAALFGLQQDESGFLRSDGGPVFTCGTCSEPQGIADSMASARAVASQMHCAGTR